jgi:hypothetical protein
MEVQSALEDLTRFRGLENWSASPERATSGCLPWAMGSRWKRRFQSRRSRHRNSRAPSLTARQQNNRADECHGVSFGGTCCSAGGFRSQIGVKMARFSASVGLDAGFSRAGQSSGKEKCAALFPAAVLDFHSGDASSEKDKIYWPMTRSSRPLPDRMSTPAEDLNTIAPIGAVCPK